MSGSHPLAGAYVERQWRPVPLASATPGRLQKLVAVCASRLDLRVSVDRQGTACLDLLCASENEFKEGEAVIQQALADEELRSRILERVGIDQERLIAGIVQRAIGR